MVKARSRCSCHRRSDNLAGTPRQLVRLFHVSALLDDHEDVGSVSDTNLAGGAAALGQRTDTNGRQAICKEEACTPVSLVMTCQSR
jgi:hypothetical protein